MDVNVKNKSKTYLNLEKRIEIGEKVKDEWLSSKKNESARAVYRSAFRKYEEFTGMTARELKEEINLEFQKPPTERRNIERRIKQFYQWLVEEQGLSENLGATYVGAIMSFYRLYNYRVNISIGRGYKRAFVKEEWLYKYWGLVN